MILLQLTYITKQGRDDPHAQFYPDLGKLVEEYENEYNENEYNKICGKWNLVQDFQ